MNSNLKSTIKKQSLILIAGISVSFVIISWIITYFTLKDTPPDIRGTFGDMFGGLNALFSGLAFCGIIVTILLQSKELRLQREEIQENRKELIRTRDIQDQQRVSLGEQAENLKISARLSALNTMLNYYLKASEESFDINKGFYGNSDQPRILREKAAVYLAEIEKILNQKS